MPTYEYFCYKEKGGCGFEWEDYMSMDDRMIPMNEPCPACEKEGTICRKLNAGNIVDPGIINADKNMQQSGVEENLNRIKENHPKANMKWKG